MTKEERINKDKKALIKNGYKRPRLHSAFNYYDDWEIAVMIYVCEDNNNLYIKYAMPNDFNIYSMFDNIVKPKIKDPIDNVDMEYRKNGAIYNVLLKTKKVIYAKVEPDLKLHIKEVGFDGKTQRMDA